MVSRDRFLASTNVYITLRVVPFYYLQKFHKHHYSFDKAIGIHRYPYSLQ